MLRVFFGLLLMLALVDDCRAALTVDGPLTVAVNQLVRLKASGQAPTAAVHWSVTPAAQVDIEELDGRCLFAAPPGTYDVVCRAVRLDGVKTVSETARVRVTIYSPGHTPAPPPAAPPAAPPATPHQSKEEAERALCLFTVPGAACTATVIGPRRKDGRWDVFCAAHCMGIMTKRATITLQDGRRYPVSRQWIDRASDGCWLTTDAVIDSMPHAFLAREAPARGVDVWQAGYGVKTRRATRVGRVSSGPDYRGWLYFGYLMVSSGDSGGAIFRSDTNEVVACVFGTEDGITCGCSCVKAVPNRPASATTWAAILNLEGAPIP